MGGDFSLETAHALWGDVCVSDRYIGSREGQVPLIGPKYKSNLPIGSLNFGYRYNPLIVLNRATIANNFDYIKNYTGTFSRKEIEVARKRAEWASEANYKVVSKEMPYFWRARQELVHFAPIGGSPSSICGNGHIRKIDFQYSLFYGEPSPRAYGNLCEVIPTVIFGALNYNGTNLEDVFQSALLRGWDLSLDRVAAQDHDNLSEDRFLDTLRKIMGLHEVQCGRPLIELDVIFEEQIKAFHIGTDTEFRPKTYMRPALRGTLKRTIDDKLVFEMVDKGQRAKTAEENAERAREAQRRLKAYRAGLGERFALGALLVMSGGALANATIFNDCNRAELPGDPPRPIYCEE